MCNASTLVYCSHTDVMSVTDVWITPERNYARSVSHDMYFHFLITSANTIASEKWTYCYDAISGKHIVGSYM